MTALTVQGGNTFVYDGVRIRKTTSTGVTRYPFRGYEIDPYGVITKYLGSVPKKIEWRGAPLQLRSSGRCQRDQRFIGRPSTIISEIIDVVTLRSTPLLGRHLMMSKDAGWGQYFAEYRQCKSSRGY